MFGKIVLESLVSQAILGIAFFYFIQKFILRYRVSNATDGFR